MPWPFVYVVRMAAFALTLAELSNCNWDTRPGRDTVPVSVLGQVPWEAESGMEICMQQTYQEVLSSSTSVREWGRKEWESGEVELPRICNWSLSLTGNCTGMALQSNPEARQGGWACVSPLRSDIRYQACPREGHNFGRGDSLWLKTIPKEGLSSQSQVAASSWAWGNQYISSE